MSDNRVLKETSPLLSVIIPVYNVEDYLREALDSVRNQSYKNVEFIAINDGSTDSSGEILQEYQLEDDRFRVLDQKNAGLSATRNLGFREANGDIIYFFDSDDILIEGTFQNVIHRMLETNSQIVMFGLALINKRGDQIQGFLSGKRKEIEKPITGKEFIHQVIPSNRYGAVVQKYFIQKSFLEKNNLTFEESYIHEDESFTLEALILADRITSFSEVMIKKRLRENSIMSTKKSVKNVEGWTRAIERVLQFLDKKNIDPKTREVALTRLQQVAHTAIRTYHGLKPPKKKIDHYLSKKTQKELGYLVKIHAKSQFLYRVLKYINRKIG